MAEPRKPWWLGFKSTRQDFAAAHPHVNNDPGFGALLHAQGNTMVVNGEAARMVLSDYDYVDGQPQLTARGYDQLVKIAQLLAVNPAPLLSNGQLAAGPGRSATAGGLDRTGPRSLSGAP